MQIFLGSTCFEIHRIEVSHNGNTLMILAMTCQNDCFDRFWCTEILLNLCEYEKAGLFWMRKKAISGMILNMTDWLWIFIPFSEISTEIFHTARWPWTADTGYWRWHVYKQISSAVLSQLYQSSDKCWWYTQSHSHM